MKEDKDQEGKRRKKGGVVLPANDTRGNSFYNSYSNPINTLKTVEQRKQSMI